METLTGDFLFTGYSFSGSNLQPKLHLFDGDNFCDLTPHGQTLTLSFADNQRYCIGWHDLKTSSNYPCPERSVVQEKYSSCASCQNRTGFNPAFYHATSISKQQQDRNAKPHFLYLAYFGPGIIKVGISWSERNIQRLLEQGARSALILATYPTADEARRFEARAAAEPQFYETMQSVHKIRLLRAAYNQPLAEKELLNAQQFLAEHRGFIVDGNEVLHLDKHFLTANIDDWANIIVVNDKTISGVFAGMIGGFYLAKQDGLTFLLPLSKLIGYHVHISPKQQQNSHAPSQLSLL